MRWTVVITVKIGPWSYTQRWGPVVAYPYEVVKIAATILTIGLDLAVSVGRPLPIGSP